MLTVDRLGLHHTYAVWSDGKIIAIGDDLPHLVRTHSQRELDWEAVASFFAFGFFIDDRTYYKDIRILEPASVYRIGDEGELLEHTRYWEWHHEPDETRTYDETVEQYHHLWKQAVRRVTAEGRIVLPISGGLDSRSIAAVVENPEMIQAYSYGYTDDSIETAISQQVAEARGMPFTAHTIQPYLFDRLHEIVSVLHGCQDVTQARQMSANAWVREHGDAVLTGLWGDVWCDQMGAADGLDEDLTSFVLHKFEKRGRHWLLENVLPAGFDPHEFLHDTVQSGLAEMDHIKDLDFRIKAYKTNRWAFRWSNASLRGFEPGATPRVPYYDNDLVDFFCTVPTEFVRDRRLQIDHLKRYAPDMATIQWQGKGTNLHLIDYARWLTLPGRAYRKASRMIRGERPIQRNWEVQFLSEGGRRNLEQHLLSDGLQIHELVAPAKIRALLDDFYADPGAANGYTVSMLLTFAAWLEVIG